MASRFGQSMGQAGAQQRQQRRAGWQAWVLGLAFASMAGASSVAATASASESAGKVTMDAQQVRALGIMSAPVAWSGQGSQTVSAQLRLPAQQMQILAAPVAGLITAIQADSGMQVRQGQWLVRMRSTQAQALKRDALQTSSQHELAERGLQRDEQLMAEGLIAQSRLDQSRAQARMARLAAQQQQQALGTALGAAQVSAHGEITLVAPMAGQVAEMMVTVGQRVDEATPLLKLANVQELWVDLQVPVQQAQGLQPGQAVQVLPTGGADTIAGAGEVRATVVSLSPMLDERTQSVTVHARLRQSGKGTLRPGQWVQARVLTSSAAPLLPESAIVTLSVSGEQAVFIEEAPGRYRLQKVQTVGRQGKDMVVNRLPASQPGAAPLRIVTHGTAALKALLKS